MAFKKPKPAVSNRVSSLPDEEGDHLGPYPKKVGVSALESRRFIWTARAFAIAFFFSIILNVILGSVIVVMLNSLYPLQRVEPWLVTFHDKADQVVSVQPLRKGVQGFDTMVEALAREYVTYVEEIIPDTGVMNERWGKILPLRSSRDVYGRLRAQRFEQFMEALRRNYTRKITIISSTRRSANRISVEFEAQTLDASQSPINITGRPSASPQLINRYEASIQFTFVPQQLTGQDVYLNPIGLVITSYTVRELSGR